MGCSSSLPNKCVLVIHGPKSTLTTIADRKLHQNVRASDLDLTMEINLDQSDIDCLVNDPPKSPPPEEKTNE